MDFDPECQAAIDFAKSALPEGRPLDAATLIAAFFHKTDAGKRVPALARFVPPLVPHRAPPGKVALEKSLGGVVRRLAATDHPLSPDEFLAGLLDSDAGQLAMAAWGMPEAEINDLLGSLRHGSSPSTQVGPAASPPPWKTSAERREALEALAPFGRLLTTEHPPAGNVSGRDQVLGALVRTLSKMKRRSTILVGHPGTGKSAVVLELARRLVAGHPAVPAALRDLDIFELSASFLRSEAGMVGQYEARVKSLLQVLKANPRIVLFLDEVHSFFQSGVHHRGPYTDANEAFKAELGRGEITVIGCTTLNEFRHYIEPDGALTRRFSVLRLEPPSAAETLEILRSRRPRMERHFSIRIPDAALARVVALADDYLPSLYQPDKSIQLLDEACAYAFTRIPPDDQLDEHAIGQALHDRIGHRVAAAEGLTEEAVFQRLAGKIKGQDAALHGIARAFVAGLGEWRRESGPRGVMLFTGPTGVGKTEVALALARVLGHDREALVRVDCNALMGSAGDPGPVIARLLGVPPGYVGYARGQGGLLSRIRDWPEAVVLFDEFEKAAAAVWPILLQILDEGRVEDSEGNRLDFRRAFLLFTTNLGSRREGPSHLGFRPAAADPEPPVDADADRVKDDLRGAGVEESFLARLRHVFLFRPLDAATIRHVLAAQLEQLRNSVAERGLELTWSDALLDHLAAQWQPRFGARHLTGILRNRVFEVLGVADAQGQLAGLARIRLEHVALPEGLSGATRYVVKDDALVLEIG